MKNAKSKNQDQSLFDDDVSAIKVESVGVTFEQIAPLRLGDFVENPDNPQTISDRAFDRLIGKLKRIPHGLMAKRIAYVTDHAAGKYVVLSGNKRLRALKQIYGDDYEPPADWFQDITSMSEDQRREYIVTANVAFGDWVASMLGAMFSKDELSQLMDDADVSAILADIPSAQKIAENKEMDPDGFDDVVELKVRLTPEDRDKAVAVLDSINADDWGAAFMSLIGGDK